MDVLLLATGWFLSALQLKWSVIEHREAAQDAFLTVRRVGSPSTAQPVLHTTAHQMIGASSDSNGDCPEPGHMLLL